MDVLYLILSVISAASVNIFSSLFIVKNKENKKGSIVFNFIMSITPLIGWAIFYAVEKGFEPFVLLYSFGFALSFIGCFIFLYFALKNGPLSLTTLLAQMSLVFTAIWGMIFWNAPITGFAIAGLCLIVVSLTFCIIKKEKDKRFSFKWLIFALLCCVSNAAASIVQKTEQLQFKNMYGGEMMFFAFVFIVVFFGIFILTIRKKIEIPNLKYSWWIASLAGLGNLLLNIFVILLAKGTMSSTIIYPTIAVGCLAINIIFSLFVYKEKLSILQIIGLVIGAVAIVFLAI